jgi:general nucleoside transport system permease protein
MSGDMAIPSTAVAAPVAPPKRRRINPWYVMIAIAAGFLVLALVRALTGANDLTSSGTVRAAVALAVPIGMAGLGGLWSERAGVVNIGLEGMMILGTWFGAWGAVHYGAWTGVLIGIIGGALGGLLHALATVSFGVDHIVSGVAVTILALGTTRYLSAIAFDDLPGGGITQSPTLPELGTLSMPGVDALLGDVEALHWFLFSDLAGVIRGLLTDVSLLTVVAILLLPLTFYVLWRTPFGLRLRSCGENPVAAESLGVNVYLYKYIAVVASGGFAGLGGVFLSMVASNIYREGQVNGRGYIGLAAMIFGNWRPGGLATGAALFGYTDGLQLRSGGESVHALLLLVALLLVAVAIWQLTRANTVASSMAAVFALVVGLWFFLSRTVPEEFVQFAPHLTTLLVLALASQRLRMPAADGLPYRRGQGG